MATEIYTSFIQITDSNLAIVSGAEVSVYAVGTTTPLSLFSDTGLGVSAANPIICDSAGRHDMRYVAAGSYKVVVRRTGAGTTIFTRDGIDGRVPIGSGALAIANGGTGATSAAAALTALGGATAAELADVSADVAALSGTLGSSEKTHIATGTTAQRPASPVEGDIRRNTTTSLYEFYDGSVWQNVRTDTNLIAAVQADQETGTSNTVFVTPGRQQLHQSSAKAWGVFAGGSGTLTASYNITSVVRDSTGDYTVTLATDFSSAAYVIQLTAQTANSSRTLRVVTQAAGSFTIKTMDNAGSDEDMTTVYFVCYGDQ